MENWKEIKGYEGLYKVSDKGNVFSHKYNRLIKVNEVKDRHGDAFRYAVSLSNNYKQKKISLHILMYETFIGNVNGFVCFKDGNFRNKKLSNLEDRQYTDGQIEFKNHSILDVVSGIEYSTIKEMSEKTGISQTAIKYGLKNKTDKYKSYQYKK